MVKTNRQFLFAFVFLALITSLWGHESNHKVWIFFDSKEEALTKNTKPEALGISKRAFDRRQLRMMTQKTLDIYDFPVSETYIQQLKGINVEPVTCSRWLNAISAWVDTSQLALIEQLPFVTRIQPVAKFRKPETRESSSTISEISKTNRLDYGSSLPQNQLMYVPQVHDMGITGKGVLIGMLDTGFDYYNRSAFAHLDVVAEHDFIWGDRSTANQAGDYPTQDNHGTRMLSTVGGFVEGELIGPAYNASYALAKTEVTGSENFIEEDYWVEGIEWLESLGVDIVNSSLGYSIFEDEGENAGYTYADMDGHTAITTIAANIAVSKGVVVVSSAGNLGNSSWKKIDAPADGDGVITVGAITRDNNLAAFSSIGPTADGRIKPDVVALGVGVYNLRPSTSRESQFDFGSGTSYSSALVSGVCALMLQAHPGLSPLEVRDALRTTADRAASPDTLFGWGLLNAPAAIFYHGMVFSEFKRVRDVSADGWNLEVSVNWKYSVDPESVTLYYQSKSSYSFHSIPMSETVNDTQRYEASLPSGIDWDQFKFYFEARDINGDSYRNPLQAPEYLYDVDDLNDEDNFPMKQEKDFSFVNYPNPFNQKTMFTFRLEEESSLHMSIYSVKGQLVKTLVDQEMPSGWVEIDWYGDTDQGDQCATGVYLARLQINHHTFVRKMLHLR